MDIVFFHGSCPDGWADNREENLSLRSPAKHPRGWSPQEMKEYLLTIPKKLGGLGPNVQEN